MADLNATVVQSCLYLIILYYKTIIYHYIHVNEKQYSIDVILKKKKSYPFRFLPDLGLSESESVPEIRYVFGFEYRELLPNRSSRSPKIKSKRFASLLFLLVTALNFVCFCSIKQIE